MSVAFGPDDSVWPADALKIHGTFNFEQSEGPPTDSNDRTRAGWTWMIETINLSKYKRAAPSTLPQAPAESYLLSQTLKAVKNPAAYCFCFGVHRTSPGLGQLLSDFKSEAKSSFAESIAMIDVHFFGRFKDPEMILLDQSTPLRQGPKGRILKYANIPSIVPKLVTKIDTTAASVAYDTPISRAAEQIHGHIAGSSADLLPGADIDYIEIELHTKAFKYDYEMYGDYVRGAQRPNSL